MRDAKFDELVNLYLDYEIRPKDFRWLQREILDSPQLQERFNEACKMRYAERVALNPMEAKVYARELAQLRGRILRPPALYPVRRHGRGVFQRKSVSIPAASGLAAALVFLFIFGQAEIRNQLDKRQLEQSYVQELVASVTPDILTSGSVTPNPVSLRDNFYAASFNLSGLEVNPREREMVPMSETFEEAYQDLVSNEVVGQDKRRLVIIIPKEALPENFHARQWKPREQRSLNTGRLPAIQASYSYND